jgi:hypothetical protein
VEVPEAAEPSTMFCLPERAAWIIWSMVRSGLVRKRRQKWKVMS